MKTKVFKSGNSLAIRLPKSMELPCGTVFIHREGRKIIIEETNDHGWPDGFFESVRISRKNFSRDTPSYTEKSL
jgi:virulence-associated protein VagC